MTANNATRIVVASYKPVGTDRPVARAGRGRFSERWGSLLNLSFAALIGLSLHGAASAGEPSRVLAAKHAAKAVALKWKGDNLAAYGDRFKAALKLQAREARKPSWSWQCEGRDTLAMKTN